MSVGPDITIGALVDQLAGPVTPIHRKLILRAASNTAAATPCSVESATCRTVMDLLRGYFGVAGNPAPEKRTGTDRAIADRRSYKLVEVA
jgi:hypothetical protein